MWAFHLTSKHPLDGGLFSSQQRHAMKANETRSIAAFRTWAAHVRRTHPPGSREEWRFTTADAHGNEQARTFNASQLSWLVDHRGQILVTCRAHSAFGCPLSPPRYAWALSQVNAIYKLEELQARWPELQAHVCGLKGIPYHRLRTEPAILALDHPSKHTDAADYYDDATAAIVAEYMAPDIRAFGYTRPQRRT